MQLSDPPFDYRDELGDDDAILACLESSKDARNWHAVKYWCDILIARDKRRRGK